MSHLGEREVSAQDQSRGPEMPAQMAFEGDDEDRLGVDDLNDEVRALGLVQTFVERGEVRLALGALEVCVGVRDALVVRDAVGGVGQEEAFRRHAHGHHDLRVDECVRRLASGVHSLDGVAHDHLVDASSS